MNMSLQMAKAVAQTMAVDSGDVVSIRRVKSRVFTVSKGHTPRDPLLFIIVHPSWVTDGHYRKIGWPEPAISEVVMGWL